MFGIRGSDPQAILEAFQTIKSEPVERCVLYQTNQGTDAHILTGEIADVRDSQSYRLHGFVAGPAQAIAGGHLFFPLQNGVGPAELRCLRAHQELSRHSKTACFGR